MKNYTVYKHTTPCGKCYIGITGRNPLKRWQNGRGYTSNDHFFRAIIKYGWENIQHEILFENLSKEEAEQKEIEMIAFYKSDIPSYGYNIQHGGNSIGKHSEETKIKIGNANRGRKPWGYGKHRNPETKKKISESQIGRKHSEETKRKISESHKGRKQTEKEILARAEANRGKKRTPEQCKNISDALKGHKGVVHTEETKKRISQTLSIPVICVETNIYYSGMRDASEKTNISSGSISMCCRGKYKTAGGFHWKYAQTI